jgi:hypothetical protein
MLVLDLDHATAAPTVDRACIGIRIDSLVSGLREDPRLRMSFVESAPLHVMSYMF